MPLSRLAGRCRAGARQSPVASVEPRRTPEGLMGNNLSGAAWAGSILDVIVENQRNPVLRRRQVGHVQYLTVVGITPWGADHRDDAIGRGAGRHEHVN